MKNALCLFVLRAAVAASLSLAAAPALAQLARDPAEVPLTKIMSDPEWIGEAPSGQYWSDDGKLIYYRVGRRGSALTDLYRSDLSGVFVERVPAEEFGAIDVRGGSYSGDFSRKVYTNGGDLFIKDLKSGEVTQLTRTADNENGARFMVGDDAVMFRRGSDVFVRELASGLEHQVADVRAQNDPGEGRERSDYLTEQQERYFEFIRKRQRNRDAQREQARAQREADATRLAAPYYVGGRHVINSASLSPNGRWMLVFLTPRGSAFGKNDSMPEWVTDDGYVNPRTVRSKVGTGGEPQTKVVLLDLANHTQHEIDLSALPGVADDPLAEVRAINRAHIVETRGEESLADWPGLKPRKEGEPRPTRVFGANWSGDGERVVMQVSSYDNKDSWLVGIEFESLQAVTYDHLRDEAWVNRRFRQSGWLADDRTLYFLSEADGYSHLYLVDSDSMERRQLTSGKWEVSGVTLDRDGEWAYFTGNMPHPGVFEFYRAHLITGEIEQLTQVGGRNAFSLSPDEKRVLIRHSTPTRPYELYVQELKRGASPERITDTTSDEFLAIKWTKPEVIGVPSSHAEDPIYSRLYLPPNPEHQRGLRPAVLFVHGAGYTQNAHKGWSSYFREFMFHTLLSRMGYVVLDMDYRASAGYGRDWRTAIYRRMGEPELEDLVDGVDYLVKNHNVDPERVGLYGGSYGGFMTLMALFNAPDKFTAGAALRPVTDWAHYNHGYTSNILNIPSVDPQAYERSSPIEFADNLVDPLLICHGMVDDNVFFEDTVRLAQLFIELGKEDWEVAMYPVEPHGFREPSSWLDEYRRIFKLFETHLK